MLRWIGIWKPLKWTQSRQRLSLIGRQGQYWCGGPPAVGCLLWRVVLPRGPVRLRMAGAAEAICDVGADDVLAAEDLFLVVAE